MKSRSVMSPVYKKEMFSVPRFFINYINPLKPALYERQQLHPTRIGKRK
ncbi:MAG: hypothetical protein K6D59_01155 [Bacteroidales bacterium]|nr:hypothetical protein [Bacteroidales bacterium]